jgi:hypothetical protein
MFYCSSKSMEKIRCLPMLDDDFDLNWRYDFEGSVSTRRGLFSDGDIMVRYSSLPNFLYCLGKRVGNFDFIQDKHKKEILGTKYVGFACKDYDEIAERMDSDAKYYSLFWDWRGDNISPTEEERKDNEFKVERMMESTNMSDIVQTLHSKGTNPRKLKYAGVVQPTGVELHSFIHILFSPAGNTYVCQKWNGMNIAKFNNDHIKGIINGIIRCYGGPVSGSLRSLI